MPKAMRPSDGLYASGICSPDCALTSTIGDSADLIRVLQRIKRTEVFAQAYIAYVGSTVEASWSSGAKLAPPEDPARFLAAFFDHTSNVVAAEVRACGKPIREICGGVRP